MTRDPIRRLRDAGAELADSVGTPPLLDEVVGGSRQLPRRSPLITVGLALAAFAIGAILFAGLSGSFRGKGPNGQPPLQVLRATVTEGATVLPRGTGFFGDVPVTITNASTTTSYEVTSMSCAALSTDGRVLFWFRSSKVHAFVEPGDTRRIVPNVPFSTDQPTRPSEFRCHVFAGHPRVLHTPVLSQQPPHPRNPVTPGFTPTDVGFWDTSHGLVAGRVDCQACADKTSGAVAVTSDGGGSWRVVLRTANPANVTVASGTSSAWVWAGGERLASTDFGATWQRLHVGGVIPESFVNANDGWGVFPSRVNFGSGGSGAVVARTTDGGRTWTGSGSPCPPRWFHGPSLPSVSFISGSDGLADCHWEVGAGLFSNDAIFRTQDGGATWTRLAMKIVPQGPSQGHPPAGAEMSMSPAGAIALSGGRAGTYRTTDGGVTWTVLRNVSSPDAFWASGFSWASPTTVFATRVGGGPSALLRSDDAGQTWRVIVTFPAR